MKLAWIKILILAMLTKLVVSCVSINNSWSEFIKTAAIREHVTFCPFNIDKPFVDVFLVNRTTSFSCSVPKSCKIRGKGTHFSLTGEKAFLSMQGFVLSGATKSAVHIRGATNQVIIRNCVFFDNHARLNGTIGGAAILLESGTSLSIYDSRFYDNQASFGGAIAVMGSASILIESSIFQDNLALHGSGIFVSGNPKNFEIRNAKFLSNRASFDSSGVIHVAKDSPANIVQSQNLGANNGECNGVYMAFLKNCLRFQQLKVPPFELGKLQELKNGVYLSQGLKIRVIARSGELVDLPSQYASRDRVSSIPFHFDPDGAAIFEGRKGGFSYVTNSESKDGGVYALEFDKSGHPSAFRKLLHGTSRNCAGGKTPWNTWISCEEKAGGQCYQVDPENKRTAEVTKLGGKEGGAFEAFAFDDRNVLAPVFFVTEDAKNGALRRFRPKRSIGFGWKMLHEEGTIDYLEFYGENQFRWTSSIAKGRQSAIDHFQNTEGITQHNGTLQFVSKVEKKMFSLDLDRGRGGSFSDQPDQLVRISSEMAFFTEDGGSSPGIHVLNDKKWGTLVQAGSSRFLGDETTGIAVSPNREFIFFCFQEAGILYQLSRIDGKPF